MGATERNMIQLLLSEDGPAALADIADELAIPASTASTELTVLKKAGLVKNKRIDGQPVWVSEVFALEKWDGEAEEARVLAKMQGHWTFEDYRKKGNMKKDKARRALDRLRDNGLVVMAPRSPSAAIWCKVSDIVIGAATDPRVEA